MEKIHFIREAKHSTHALAWQLVGQGIVMIFLGIVIILYPQLLILFFAFAFILIGLSSLVVAYKIRRFAKKFDTFFDFFG
ncbi:hypothetical protein BK004_04245 [bacterium CG10_46_32]|nr:MAG: hypothetical protein BK004_04245 [bacterium CG10_46_32]PIR55828.1 MAG: hypothetical protein COU73_04285 [Parcubacteria group bacterium CG10_big_fil_rev_8_21_14_0_10_46_32]